MKKCIVALAVLWFVICGALAQGSAHVTPALNVSPAVGACRPGPAPRAGGGNLVVGNVALHETPHLYRTAIKYLTVAPEYHQHRAFHGSDIGTIRSLEDPLRRQIFDAMNHNNAERFVFAKLRSAQENFAMRIEAIKFMTRMNPKSPRHVDFGYKGKGVPVQADRHWGILPPGFAFGTLPGVRAADAIKGMISHRFRGECLGAVEITVLQAAEKALGAVRFNALHAKGLGVGPNTGSFRPHVRPAAQISLRAMVPGDWVYMKNQDDYNTDLRPGIAPGYWTGENALYMGRYETAPHSVVPQYRTNAPQKFSGMGVYDVTDTGMRHELKKGYVSLMQGTSTNHFHPLSEQNIRWTQVNRLVTGN